MVLISVDVRWVNRLGCMHLGQVLKKANGSTNRNGSLAEMGEWTGSRAWNGFLKRGSFSLLETLGPDSDWRIQMFPGAGFPPEIRCHENRDQGSRE